MLIEFSNPRVALIETDRAAETGLPVAVIQQARQRLNLIRAAPDIGTMLAWKSLGYVPENDLTKDRGAILIGQQWSLQIQIEENCIPNKLKIMTLQENVRGVA